MDTTDAYTEHMNRTWGQLLAKAVDQIAADYRLVSPIAFALIDAEGRGMTGVVQITETGTVLSISAPGTATAPSDAVARR